MTISALFATTTLVLVRAGWMRVVSASCLVSATCLLFSLSLSLFWVWFASDAGSLSDLSLLVYIKCIEIVQYLAPLCVSPRRIPICPPFEKCCPVQPAIGKKKNSSAVCCLLSLARLCQEPLKHVFLSGFVVCEAQGHKKQRESTAGQQVSRQRAFNVSTAAQGNLVQYREVRLGPSTWQLIS